MTNDVRFAAIFLSLTLGSFTAQAQLGGPTVSVNDFSAATTVIFDPRKAPGAPAGGANGLPGPPVDSAGNSMLDGHDAVTVCEVTSSTDTVVSGGVTTTTITVTGGSTIYMPLGGGATLLAHEQGHHTLCGNEYAKNAARKMREATQAQMTLGSSLSDAENRGLQAIRDQMSVLNGKYDALTRHGTNSLTAEEAIAMALTEREADHSVFKVPPGLPSTRQPWGGTSPDPPWLQFDPTTYRVSLGGDVLIAFAADSNDAIIGRGAFEMDPTLLIGQSASGIWHLADTAFRIRDQQTGALLMSAYLLEAGYLDSTLPGYAGMIQAVLDIPPSFTGAIDNSLHSLFLAGMADASEAAAPTAVWFFTEQRLFDVGADGGVVGQRGPSIGILKAGVLEEFNVPEPSTILLLGITGLVSLGLRVSRLRSKALLATFLLCLGMLPAKAGIVPATDQFLLNFDTAGGRGDLMFDDTTGIVSIRSTTVSELFLGTAALADDTFLGATVTGSGRFVGASRDIPGIRLIGFQLTFTMGTHTVLTLRQSGTADPILFAGSGVEAFDFGELEITMPVLRPDSGFLSAINAEFGDPPIKWKGGMSYIFRDGVWVVHDAYCIVDLVPLPEPGTLGLLLAGLAVLGTRRPQAVPSGRRP